MHVDFYLAPPAPSPYRAPTTKKSERSNSFVYTGDQFLFTGERTSELRPYRPPAATDTTSGFWAWLGQLFH